MADLKLHFFGLPTFVRDGRPVEVVTGKGIALLAYLAVSREPRTRDKLLGLLWAESPEEAARKNLRNALWALRRALGEGLLQSDGDTLALAESAWVDVWEMESAAVRALSIEPPLPSSILELYRGPFLEGFTVGDAPEFEIWMTGERERLEQLYLRALSGLIETHQAMGGWNEVIDLARRGLLADSLQEPMHRALMEAYARLGQRPEAIRQYDLLRMALDRELGVAPLPETEELRESILRGDLQPAAIPSLPRSALESRTSQRSRSGTPFVGRRDEKAVLDAEFQEVAGGRTRVVLLTGEIGIGKSRLWSEWSSRLTSESVILRARCLASTQALPFAPLTELFGSQVCMRQLLARPSTISPVWLSEVARLLPEIRAALPDLPEAVPLPPEEERQRLFESFVQLLRGLNSQPLVLFIDDLQWADRATLDWLDYLVHRMADSLLLVVAYRPEDAPSPLVHLVARWGREGVSRRLPLQRLSDEESLELIASLGADPALADRIRTRSSGNPFFILELTRAGSDDLPPLLAELVRARVDGLPEASRQVLQAAAVLEPDFDFTTLRRTGGRSEEETLDALDILLGAGVLVEAGNRYGFSHPLVATIVREGLGGARSAYLHRRAGEAVEATHGGRLPQIAGILAFHFSKAGDAERAAGYAEMAAERAMRLAAPAEAVGFYRQALDLAPTPHRRLGLGEALLRLGDLAGARSSFEGARLEFQSLEDDRGIAQSRLRLASTYLPAGRGHEAVRLIEEALAYIDPETDPSAHAEAHFLLGAGHLHAGRPLAEAEWHLRESARLAAEHGIPLLEARSRFEMGNLRAQQGKLAEAVRTFEEAASLAGAAGDQLQEVLSHNNAAYHSILAGDLGTARQHIEVALDLASRRELRLPLQYLYSTRGELAMAEGEWEEAERWFKEGILKAEANGNAEQAANYRANLGLAARGRGDLDEALDHLATARESAGRLISPRLQTQIDLWMADLHMAREEWAAAEEVLRSADERISHNDQVRFRGEAAHLRQRLIRQEGG